MTVTSRAKGNVVSKRSQRAQHHSSDASLGQSGKGLLKVSTQKPHSCSPRGGATSGAGSRSWQCKHPPGGTHFKGRKDARFRDGVMGRSGGRAQGSRVWRDPSEPLGGTITQGIDWLISFENILVDQPTIWVKKKYSALRVKSPAFKVLTT